MKNIVAKILVLAFLVSLVVILVPGLALGERFVLDGGNNGLGIYIPSKLKDTGNLNPGDKMDSCLTLSNNGGKTITVYIRTNILNETSPNGGNLSDIMTLTIKDGGKIIADGDFKQVSESGNVLIGEIQPNGEKELCFYTDLPKEAGNKYQGASFKANWTFTTQVTGGTSDDDDDDHHGGGTKPPKDDETPQEPSVEIGDEPIPFGPGTVEDPSDPEIVIIEDEDVPTGPADMPRTGEIAPFYYYGIGALVIILGARMRKK